MIPGYQTLGSIEQALQQLRAQENDANNRLDEAMRQLAEAKAEETEHYRALARLKLRSGAEALGGRMDQATLRARAVLALRDNEKTLLDARLDAAAKAIAHNADARTVAGESLAAAEDDKHALIAKSDRDGTYQALREQASRSRIIAEEAEKKAALSEAELAQKRKPYENDPVFMYLWANGFSTSAYNGRGLVKMMDGWAARLVGFFDARPNYAMLNEIPKRLRDYANATMTAARQSAQALEEAQARAFLGAGGAEAERKLNEVKSRISQLEGERQQHEQTYAKVQAEARAFAEGRDPRYSEAVDTLAGSLSGQGLDALYRQAKDTPTAEDDALVSNITRVQGIQRDAEAAANRTRQDLQLIGQRRNEIAQVASQFRQSRFDVDGSRFDNNVIGSLLQGLVIGALSSSDFWSRMTQSRHYDGPLGGGNWGGWAGGSDSSGSGGAWGGGSSGGGRDDGDGFSTGGSF